MHRFLIALTLSAPLFVAHADPRADLLAQCPALATELPERLAHAKQSVDRDGLVQVTLRVADDGQLAIEQLDGTRAYQGATRVALNSLRCPGAAPERYSLKVRFEDAFPISSTQLALAR
jgi:hypothetical protein